MRAYWALAAATMALGLGSGCKHPTKREALVEGEGSAPAGGSASPTGALRDGVWADQRYPWALHVPPGWEVLPGEEGANPRVTLVHLDTRARLEVSVVAGGELGPRERRGCAWEFTDDGGYRALAIPGPIRVGTCTPDDARHARVLGYFVRHDAAAYDLEEVLPPGRLVEGKAAADALLGGFRLYGAVPTSR